MLIEQSSHLPTKVRGGPSCCSDSFRLIWGGTSSKTLTAHLPGNGALLGCQAIFKHKRPERCREEAREIWTNRIRPAITGFAVQTAALPPPCLNGGVPDALMECNVTAWIRLFYAIPSAALKCCHLRNDWLSDLCLFGLVDSNWVQKDVLQRWTSYCGTPCTQKWTLRRKDWLSEWAVNNIQDLWAFNSLSLNSENDFI